ncbi:hypothetical protein K2Y00_00245 [Patescibacteria group bacterium]|nr:hypothetical protein [Patescibacteria group bacterium]
MNIAEIGRQSKAMLSRVPTDALYLTLVVLVAIASFQLGMLNERQTGGEAEFSIEYLGASAATPSLPEAVGGVYVGSVNGTKYHLPSCPGARTISEGNKIWFASKAEAEAAGYTPAANCKGI